MSGTKTGSRKAVTKILAKDPDFFKRIGKIGGQNGHTGGFAYPLLCDCNYMEDLHKKAICAGAKGGSIGRRRKVIKENQHAS